LLSSTQTESLRCSCRFPRRSLVAPSTLLTPLSFYSAGRSRSNFKSPASIFHMFKLGHRYPSSIDPSSLLIAASYSFPRFLRSVTSSVRDRCFIDLCVATCSLPYFHRYFQYILRPLSSSDNRLPTNRGAPFRRQW